MDQPGTRVGRPGLQAALREVESGQAEGVIVARLDRFGRSVQDSANLLARISDADGTLLTVQESINTSGYMGEFLVGIFSSLAQLELARIREGWSTARAAAVERGIHISGRVPTGYRKGKDGLLFAGPKASVIAELFRRRGANESWVGLARFLERKRVVTPWGNRHWTAATVRSIIRNRVYLGEARAGEFVKPGAHPAIVTPSEYEAANRARGVTPSRSGRATGLLSGLLRCAGCRYAMKASMGKTRHGKPFLEYRCRPTKAGGRCKSPASTKATVIEPYVLGRFFDYAGATTVEGRSADYLGEAEHALAQAEAELAAALDERLADVLGKNSEAYLAVVRERSEAVEQAREELGQTRGAVEFPDVNLREAWPDLGLDEQRQLLASAFDCVFVRRTPNTGKFPIADRTHICRWGEAPALPIRGQRGTIRPFSFR